jgi:Type IV secretion-system coupling protein DNA-binding domain
MPYSNERCLNCSDASTPVIRVPDTDYWYCSQKCYQQAFSKYLDPEYGLDKRASDTSEAAEISDVINTAEYKLDGKKIRAKAEAARSEYYDRWYQTQRERIAAAQNQLRRRIQNEFNHQTLKEKEKIAERQRIEQEKIAERERREQEKLDEKRRIEQNKLDEKQRKLDEEEEARELAEEAWRETLKPKPIPEKLRLEHVHVLGPSGSGKTTLLQDFILTDFLAETKGREWCAYIIIDPKGLMLQRFRNLKKFVKDYKRRLVIVDPFEDPALNLFKKFGRNPAQLISDFRYIFSTTNQKMTGKQTPCFSFCAQLLFTLPQANLFTLLDLLDDRTNKKPPNPLFLDAISKLPDVARRFFDDLNFYGANYASTREELKARIWGVLESEHLATMFNATNRKLDLDKCIREKKIVIVNTRMNDLKEAHQTFGRYIIALTKDAILSREERHPVYLMIDEFQEFADEQKTPEMLRLIREYGGGAVLAHQNMYCAELNDATRNAISTNTSIKYAASPEAQDLNYMARDLRCEPEWLKSIHKTDTHARFACYVRGMNPPLQHPFVVQSKLGWIDTWPKMSDDELTILRSNNYFKLQDVHPSEMYGEMWDVSINWDVIDFPQRDHGHPDPRRRAFEAHQASVRAEASRAKPVPPVEADKSIITHKAPTGIEASRVKPSIPAEADKPIVPPIKSVSLRTAPKDIDSTAPVK